MKQLAIIIVIVAIVSNVWINAGMAKNWLSYATAIIITAIGLIVAIATVLPDYPFERKE